MEMIQQLDAKIILWIQEHVVCDGLNAPMLLISKMGNAGWFWILLGILLMGLRQNQRQFSISKQMICFEQKGYNFF